MQFFKTDLQWSEQWSERFAEVCLWQDWEGRHGRPDTGIDLVAEDAVTGETVAI